jgi:hypothetical protein
VLSLECTFMVAQKNIWKSGIERGWKAKDHGRRDGASVLRRITPHGRDSLSFASSHHSSRSCVDLHGPNFSESALNSQNADITPGSVLGTPEEHL